MLKNLLRLWLGVVLIAASSLVLLLSDQGPSGGKRGAGRTGDRQRVFSVALFQHVSQPTIEEGVHGAIDALAAAGYRDKQSIQIHKFSAEADAATSNTIARTIVGGKYDLVITVTTPSLQALAGANRDAKVPHVFGMVSDPVVAGVGIARDDPMKHPPYMTGLGTMQPVAECFRLAQKLNPKLARVGVAWNPSEANSEACTKIARATCKELGIELLESPVDSSANVRESVSSVIARGVDAIWVGGDNTVLGSLDAVIGAARAGNVPVFTNIPGCAARGALFDLGADYYRVGSRIGELASEVLGGRSPADMPILYEVPPEFWLNDVVLAQFKESWAVPKDVLAQADVVVEHSGPVRKKERPALEARPARPTRRWKLGLVSYSDATVIEEGRMGIDRGLHDAGLVEGRDYTLVYRNAQSDIATLNTILDEMNGGDIDGVIILTSVALQAALRKIDSKPVVFAIVLDPFAAKAGTSDTDHRPNVTGAYLAFPYREVARAIHEILPSAKRVGTLFAPAEVNSRVAQSRFEKVLKEEGFELVSRPVNGPTEVADAALGLCQARIDVFCQISDNLSSLAFPAIAHACDTTKTPLFSFAPPMVKRGAMIAVGADYEDNGHAAGLMVADLIRGKDPAQTPFRAITTNRRAVNLDTARRYGVQVPADWVRKANLVLPHPPDESRAAGAK